MIPDCPECGARMSLIDETTKLIEYRCPDCFEKEIVRKDDE